MHEEIASTGMCLSIRRGEASLLSLLASLVVVESKGGNSRSIALGTESLLSSRATISGDLSESGSWGIAME